MKANYYDVLDTFTSKTIIKQKRVRDIAKELGVDGKKISMIIYNERKNEGNGLIKKRYRIIGDKKYDFTFTDEDGIRKKFSQEWDKAIKNLSRVEKRILQKIVIVGRE